MIEWDIIITGYDKKKCMIQKDRWIYQWVILIYCSNIILQLGWIRVMTKVILIKKHLGIS